MLTAYKQRTYWNVTYTRCISHDFEIIFEWRNKSHRSIYWFCAKINGFFRTSIFAVFVSFLLFFLSSSLLSVGIQSFVNFALQLCAYIFRLPCYKGQYLPIDICVFVQEKRLRNIKRRVHVSKPFSFQVLQRRIKEIK